MLNPCEDHMRRFSKSTMEEGRITSFAEYGKTTDKTGGPAVLFLSESPPKDGIGFIHRRFNNENKKFSSVATFNSSK